MKLNYFIRLVKKSDYNNWIMLWNDYLIFCNTNISEEISKNTFNNIIDLKSNISSFVAEDSDKKLLGFVIFVCHPTSFSLNNRFYIEDLFTHPKSRRQGVAYSLIKAVETLAIQSNSDKLYWHTGENNYIARMLYDKIAKKTQIVYTKMLI